MVPMSEAR